MTKHQSTLFLGFFVSLLAFGQNTLLWPTGAGEINTGVNSTYVVQGVSLDGSAINFGYELGAFYLDDQGELVCGGITPWTGSTTQIAVMGDDATTPSKDGFSEGEEITYFALNTYNQITYEANVTYQFGSSLFSSNGLNIISEFTLVPQTSGCTDSTAFNYDSTASSDDGSCIAVVDGCSDTTAFNYNADANTDNGSCIAVVNGCTDETALNYNADANTDDVSCIAVVNGCTDETALNYNTDANTDDGSCIAVVNGCTDETAFNYNADANTDDESCIAVVNGCTSEQAINFDSLANTDDGSCVGEISGCIDTIAFNFDPVANTDDSSCIDKIFGCIDTIAFNFNALANTDDGSCIDKIFGCTDTLAFNFNTSANTSDDSLCIDVFEGCLDETAFNYNSEANVSNDSCIDIIIGCLDTLAFNFNIDANTDDASLCVEFIFGCIDTTAFNFNIDANTTDESCVEVILGCIDSLSFNYDQEANTDNGTCSPIELGCMNILAFNYNSESNMDDDSCLLEIELNFNQILTNNTTNYNIPLESAALILGEDSISNGDLIGGFYIVNGLLYCAGYSTWTGSDLSIPLWQDNPDTEQIDGITEGSTVYWIAQQTQTMFNYVLSFETQLIGLQTIFVTSISVNQSIVIGCNDSSAFNYNIDAFISDGSCIEIIEGCTEENACNFNPEANTEDNSCEIITATLGVSAVNTLTVQTDALEPSYVWTINGSPTGNNSNILLIFLEGQYEVIITDINGCEVSSQITIEELSLDNLVTMNLILYPNPSKSSIKVEIVNGLIESIELFALNGQVLSSRVNINKETSRIERMNLKPGMYFARISSNTGDTILKKVIFE